MSCEYCGSRSNDMSITNGLEVTVDSERRALLVEVMVSVMGREKCAFERVPIRYCPMCGRELEG